MKKKFFKTMLAASTLLLSSVPVFAADDINLNNDSPSTSQGTVIDLNIESEATVKIPKNVAFNINAQNNNAKFNETTNCYEYYITVSASGNVLDSESVFVGIDDASLVFTNKTNPSDYFTGDIFYHNEADGASYDTSNLEGVWSKTVLEDTVEANRQKQLVVAVPSDVVLNSGYYQTTVNFNVNKGVESSALSSWSTMYKYKLVGNGDAVILGFADNAGQSEINSMETMVIPKKIKTASGVYASVVGIEAGAFKGNTHIKTLKIPADCALSVYTSGEEGDKTSGWSTAASGNNSSHIASYANSYKATPNTNGTTTYIWREGTSSTKIIKDIKVVGAFEGCTNLEKVIISGNVSQISRNTFKNCTKLASIGIPASCKWVGVGAFIGCPSLNITATSNTKFAKFVHFTAGSYNSYAETDKVFFASTSETTIKGDYTTNIFDSELTGIVFDTGIHKVQK